MPTSLADAVRSGIRVTGTNPLEPGYPPAPFPEPGHRRRGRPAQRLRPRVGRVRPGAQVPPGIDGGAGAARAGALDVVTTTLDAMASGGIYDHLGGGFARYAVERRWLVPHFEKMLYDNAQLIRLYTHGWQVTGADRYRQVVEETVAYLLRPPMRSPAGGIHSAEDADSEGVEGKFYVWSLDEVEAIGGRPRSSGTASPPRATGRGTTSCGGPSEATCSGRRRWRRPAGGCSRSGNFGSGPGLDDKVVTEWNAMAVAALAEAGAAMGRTDWMAAAVEVAEFLLSSLRRRRRALAAGLAGRPGRSPPGLRRRLRLAGRGLHPAGRGDRRGPLGRRGPRRRPTSSCALFWDDEEGGFFTTGARRREADRAVQGHLRRGHAVGQLGRRRGPAAPGRPDRRGDATATPARRSST